MSQVRYAGIGSRKTPEDICRKMFAAGKAMAKLDFILRSGGAKGADSAFESGALAAAGNEESDVRTEIFLPFQRFNGHTSNRYGTTKAARIIAKEYHPRWDILSSLGRDFHARNVYQILGEDLHTPSDFVLCWTPNGSISGGTGQALRIAKNYGIPILNFATDEDDYISDFIFSISERNAG